MVEFTPERLRASEMVPAAIFANSLLEYIRVLSPVLWSTSGQAPALSHFGANVPVGFRAVGELHEGAVPFQFAVDAQRDHAHRDPLRERSGNIEIRTGRIAAFAGADPISMMAGRSGQVSRRQGVILQACFRQQPDIGAVSIGGEEPLGSD